MRSVKAKSAGPLLTDVALSLLPWLRDWPICQVRKSQGKLRVINQVKEVIEKAQIQSWGKSLYIVTFPKPWPVTIHCTADNFNLSGMFAAAWAVSQCEDGGEMHHMSCPWLSQMVSPRSVWPSCFTPRLTLCPKIISPASHAWSATGCVQADSQPLCPPRWELKSSSNPCHSCVM